MSRSFALERGSASRTAPAVAVSWTCRTWASRARSRAAAVSSRRLVVMREDLMHGPHDSVPERPCGQQPGAEEHQLDPRQWESPRGGAALEAVVPFGPVEVEEADARPDQPQPAKRHSRGRRHRLVAELLQVRVEEVQIRVRAAGEACDARPRVGHAMLVALSLPRWQRRGSSRSHVSTCLDRRPCASAGSDSNGSNNSPSASGAARAGWGTDSSRLSAGAARAATT